MEIRIIEPKFFMMNCKFISPALSYEHYLIDIVNGSRFFRRKCSHLEQYKLQEKQSNGEDDIVSSIYNLDCKLLVDQDTMNSMSKNKPEVDYSQKQRGYILVKTKQPSSEIIHKNILLEIIKTDKEDFFSGDGLNDSMRNLRKNLGKNKNLFIYYPYEFKSEKEVAVDAFASMLTEIMRLILEYRTSVQGKKDTYVCFKANSHFLIFEWDGSRLVYQDSVHEGLCGNYRDAKSFSFY